MVIFALILSLSLFGLFVMVIDLSVLYSGKTRVQAAAQIGAQAGADTVSSTSLYRCSGPQLAGGSGSCSGAVLGASSASMCEQTIQRALTALPANGGGQHCSATGSTVHASITRQVRMPLGLFGTSFQVSGDFDAAAVRS
ncbi:MAG: hypothetical protein ACR2NJ_12965 [Acidimicrobiales bacterium]